VKRTTSLVVALFLFLVHFMGFSATSEPVRLYAAGSLRVVMTEMGQAFAKREGGEVPVFTRPGDTCETRIRTGKSGMIVGSTRKTIPVRQSGGSGS
jgi:ABC-type molybdate transport system substrate-binding protein